MEIELPPPDLILNEEDQDFLLQKAGEILEHFNLLDNIDIDLLAEVVEFFCDFIVASLKTFIAWKIKYKELLQSNNDGYRSQ